MHCCHQNESAVHIEGGNNPKAANSIPCQSYINLESSQGTALALLTSVFYSFSHTHTHNPCHAHIYMSERIHSVHVCAQMSISLPVSSENHQWDEISPSWAAVTPYKLSGLM